MIRKNSSGRYYCDGRECGFPLHYAPADPEEHGESGMWICLDCNASMYAAPPKVEAAK